MFNYYIKEDSYNNCSIQEVESNLKELNIAMINSTSEDEFFYCSVAFYSVLLEHKVSMSEIIFSGLHDIQFMRQVLPRLLIKLRDTKRIESIDAFNEEFNEDINAFWGINFMNKLLHELTCYTDLYNFKIAIARQNINKDNFSQYALKLFSSLIFCPDVYDQIKLLYDEKIFNQFLHQLEILDSYAEKWTNGNFEMFDLQKNTSLSASGESSSVNNNKEMRKERTFQLPDKSFHYFENHIKTGDLRIYFLPDNDKHTFYIGYVGNVSKHLKSAKY